MAKDAWRLEIENRTLILQRGRGWMGQTPWWTPSNEASRDVLSFLDRVQLRLHDSSIRDFGPGGKHYGSNSPSATAYAYSRYVEAYEIEVPPRHSNLQGQFEKYLRTKGATSVRPNQDSVDLRFRDPGMGLVLAEIKPCERTSARHAIRTAIGQLLDYRQGEKAPASILIVVEINPNEEDQLLAISNGFGLAYPEQGSFTVLWPET